MSRHYYSGSAVDSTLTAAITSSGTVLTVPESAADNNWPSTFPYYLAIDPGTLSEEIVEVASKGALSGSTRSWNVTRGTNPAAVAHSQNAIVRHVLSAGDAEDFAHHVFDDDGSLFASHLTLPRGVLARVSTWASRATPTNGAETVIGYTSGVMDPIRTGRLYRFQFRSDMSRSDNAQDLGIVRCRIGTNTTSGTAVYTGYQYLNGSLVPLPVSGYVDFLGAATTTTTSTTNQLYTVAAGTNAFTLTLQKNSGTGNTATLGMSNMQFTIEDLGGWP